MSSSSIQTRAHLVVTLNSGKSKTYSSKVIRGMISVFKHYYYYFPSSISKLHLIDEIRNTIESLSVARLHCRNPYMHRPHFSPIPVFTAQIPCTRFYRILT
jgi:hypothetical protein